MKRLTILMFLLAAFLFTGCTGSYTTIDLKDPLAKVSGYDTQYKDVLTIHCRTPMDLIVDIRGESMVCKSGDRLSFTHNFSIAYSSNSSRYARVPVLIYPKEGKYSNVEGYADSWSVRRNRNSDASWLVELDRRNRLDVKEAR